jgi:hypothetical protein
MEEGREREEEWGGARKSGWVGSGKIGQNGRERRWKKDKNERICRSV